MRRHHQLVGLSGPGVTASFQYDALGRRKSKTVNGVTADFLYDGHTTVQELSGGSVQANLLLGIGIDEVLQRTDTVSTRSFLADGLGSTLALTDTAGTVQTEYTYEPFGTTTTSGAASANPSQYTGRENDGTGLYYYRARYYHPGLQRFVSEDPIEFEGEDLNLYRYTLGDPINGVDPTGTQIVLPLPPPPIPGIPGGKRLPCITCPTWDPLPDDTYHPPLPDDHHGSKEHTKGARPSTEEKHQKGQKRQEMDKQKKEKGDAKRKRYK